jgi:glycosyltransferase involved in cell wall biosynthesis
MVELVSLQDKNVKFLVAGGGDLLQKSQKTASDKKLPVIFLGWRSDIENILSASDIVVLTSDNEGTPLSLIQGGMAGLPVISTNVGSISDVVISGETGFLVDADLSQLVDAIEKLASNVELRQKLGENAKEFTKMNFGVERLVSNHEDLYKSML